MRQSTMTHLEDRYGAPVVEAAPAPEPDRYRLDWNEVRSVATWGSPVVILAGDTIFSVPGPVVAVIHRSNQGSSHMELIPGSAYLSNEAGVADLLDFRDVTPWEAEDILERRCARWSAWPPGIEPDDYLLAG